MNWKDTIFAVSTGAGRAGIAVVRMSGPDVQNVLTALSGQLPPARRAALKQIRSAATGDVIDRGMVLFFPGPASVTGEDVGEFHVHGSAAVVERLLSELAGFENCRPALAGEFTRRAFQNERLDLVEVEGLADLLAAETEGQRRLAMRQFSGAASNVYAAWYQDLSGLLAIIEAAIDFADEDGVAAAAVVKVRPRIEMFAARLGAALQESEKASLVRRGLRVVIAGAPNVGKSSLLNTLAGRKAAIVSDIAGTTRDVVEAGLVLNGVQVSLADTAGIREHSADVIEAEGILRSHAEIENADILVWVSSATSETSALPTRVPDLHVINKADLVSKDSILLRNESELPVSVRTGEGIDVLHRKLSQLVGSRSDVGETGVMVRARHQDAVRESIRFLNDALAKGDDALELMAEDVRKAAAALASITGRVDVEDFLGRIFQEFCIGK